MSTATALRTIKDIADGRQDTFKVMPEELTLITDKGHPLYDERVELSVDEAMVKSILEHGIRENVNVRRVDGVFEVLDGRQRVKAALEANKRLKAAGKSKSEFLRVPVTMVKDNDDQAAKVMVALNEIRLDDTPLVKAAKAKRLLDRGVPKADVAAQFGKPVSAIEQLVRVLETDKQVQDAVEKGTISVTAASKLAALPRDEQKKAITELRDSGKAVTNTQVRARVKASRSGTEVTLAPSRKLVAQVCDAYEAMNSPPSVPAHKLMKWILTGKDADKIVPGPGTVPTLAVYLRDLDAGPAKAKK